MPDLLIRNLPAHIHARLRAAAEANRRSVTQETIVTLERGLNCNTPAKLPTLPQPLAPRRKITMKETIGYIHKDRP